MGVMEGMMDGERRAIAVASARSRESVCEGVRESSHAISCEADIGHRRFATPSIEVAEEGGDA